MGNGALAIGPKLPRPSSTLPQRTSTCATSDQMVETIVRGEEKPDPHSKNRWFEPSIGVRNQAHRRLHSASILGRVLSEEERHSCS